MPPDQIINEVKEEQERNGCDIMHLGSQAPGNKNCEGDRCNELIPLQLGTFTGIGDWVLTAEDRKALRRAFEVMYRNRLANEELRNGSELENFSFQPMISRESERLAGAFRQKMLSEAAGLIQEKKIQMEIPADGKLTHQ